MNLVYLFNMFRFNQIEKWKENTMNRHHRRALKSKKKGNNMRINPRTQKGKMGGFGAHRPATIGQRIKSGLDE